LSARRLFAALGARRRRARAALAGARAPPPPSAGDRVALQGWIGRSIAQL